MRGRSLSSGGGGGGGLGYLQLSDLPPMSRGLQPLLEVVLDSGLQLLPLLWTQPRPLHLTVPLASCPVRYNIPLGVIC